MMYTKEELMIIAASRLIGNKDVVLVGIGLPILAALLAKRTHAPGIKLLFESGAIDADPFELPQGPGDFMLLSTAVMNTSLFDALGYVQRGKVDVAFLGAGEIDMYGNLNATVIGDYYHPTVRLPGSGGANDMASCAGKTVVISRHERRKFPEKVSYVTTPGYLNGEVDARQKTGLVRGGPAAVITDYGVFDFDEETRRMRIRYIHPGVDKRDIINATQFEILGMDKAIPVTPIDRESIDILQELDRFHHYIRKK